MHLSNTSNRDILGVDISVKKHHPNSTPTSKSPKIIHKEIHGSITYVPLNLVGYWNSQI